MELIQTGFQHACGPVFSRRGYLLFCDVQASKILKLDKGSLTAFRQPANEARALTFDHQGCLLACEKDRVTRTEKSDKITVLAARLAHPSDVLFAIDGNIYYTAAGGVSQLRQSGTMILTRTGTQPTSLALSANQQTLYVADQTRIQAFQLLADGALTQPQTFAKSIAAALKTDEAGRLYAATAEGIAVFDNNGRQIETLRVPEAVTGCNWGEGFHNLYVTTQSSLYLCERKANGTRTY